MTIDSATLAYQSRPIAVPKALQGSGAVMAADSRSVDRSSPLYEQCREFEGLFVEMMLKEMRKTLNKEDSILDGGQAEEIFEDMLYQEYAAGMTKASNFGLADKVYLELVRSGASAKA